MSLDKTGIYIHIPFCRNKCDYCSFYSIPADAGDRTVKSYVNKLKDEITGLPDEWYSSSADTIYFGGGTPSLLGARDLESIIFSIKKKFSFTGDAEITLEMNPEDFSIDKIREYKDCGVNRIVFGVQSLNGTLRDSIGRRGKKDIQKKVESFFLETGFIKCIDLITGIPGQNKENCLDDLELIVNGKPEHISLYLLSVETGTPLSGRLIADDLFEEMQLAVWSRSMDFLADKGYSHYEISNYSLPGFESIHNSKYWHFVPYAGFGAGAHSFTGSRRYSNNMSVADYIRSENVLYTFDNRTDSDIVVEFFMTALRDLRGFSEEEYISVTGAGIPYEIAFKLKNLINEEYISFNNGNYALTRKGLFQANSVIYELTEKFIR